MAEIDKPFHDPASRSAAARSLSDPLPDDWLEGFEKAAAWAIIILSPDKLLLSMWGPHHSRGQDEAWLAIGGGYGGYGERHPEADRWPALERYLRAHPGFRASWARLAAAGLRMRFASFQEHNLHGFYIVVAIDEPSLAAIRRLAREDAGARTEAEARDFDARFDLYLKQNWTHDDAERNAWREREPLAIWPWSSESGPRL